MYFILLIELHGRSAQLLLHYYLKTAISVTNNLFHHFGYSILLPNSSRLLGYKYLGSCSLLLVVLLLLLGNYMIVLHGSIVNPQLIHLIFIQLFMLVDIISL